MKKLVIKRNEKNACNENRSVVIASYPLLPVTYTCNNGAITMFVKVENQNPTLRYAIGNSASNASGVTYSIDNSFSVVNNQEYVIYIKKDGYDCVMFSSVTVSYNCNCVVTWSDNGALICGNSVPASSLVVDANETVIPVSNCHKYRKQVSSCLATDFRYIQVSSDCTCSGCSYNPEYLIETVGSTVDTVTVRITGINPFVLNYAETALGISPNNTCVSYMNSSSLSGTASVVELIFPIQNGASVQYSFDIYDNSTIFFLDCGCKKSYVYNVTNANRCVTLKKYFSGTTTHANNGCSANQVSIVGTLSVAAQALVDVEFVYTYSKADGSTYTGTDNVQILPSQLSGSSCVSVVDIDPQSSLSIQIIQVSDNINVC